MSLIHAIRRTTPSRSTSDSTGPQAIDASRAGELFTMDWRQRRIAEGKGFQVNVGALTTAIVGGGNGTVFDAEQSEYAISVPSGKLFIPLRIEHVIMVPLLAADSEEVETFVGVDRTAVSTAAAGTGTVETAFNLRTDNPAASSVTAVSANTSDHNTPTIGLELARMSVLGDFQGTPANAMWTNYRLEYQPITAPILVGPCALYGYWFGTVAASGYATIQWIELDSTEII